MSNNGASERPGFRPNVKQVVGGLLVIVAIVLVLQNTQSVRVHVLAWNVEWPLWVVMVLMLAIGAIVGWTVSWRSRRR